MNYIDKLKKNLKCVNVRNISPKETISQLNNKSLLSFSHENSKKNKNDVFITFKLDNARKVNDLIENNLYTFSNNINNNYIINNNKFSNGNSSIFFNLNPKNKCENKNTDSKRKSKNKSANLNSDNSSRNFDYIHYTDAPVKKHEYRTHNINFEDTNINQNNINDYVNENISGNELVKQNFLERRNQIIEERISRSFSNSKKNENRRNMFYRFFSIPKNESFRELIPYYYESDKESSKFKLSFGEINKEKNNNLICNLRNLKHNHNRTSSRNNARKAAYEKSAKNISFLAFKMNQEKANEIKKVNFMHSLNRIRNQHSGFHSRNISGFGLKENFNSDKIYHEEGEIDNEEVMSEKELDNFSNKNGITCKIISDAEVVIKWLRSLKIKDVEKVKFFDDSYKDNTKYMKNTRKESIMSEIKKGY